MAVQKKSLIGNRPTEKKGTTKAAKRTAAIGESKALTANALKREALKANPAMVRSMKDAAILR